MASIRTRVGQLFTPNRFQMTWSASLTTGCLIPYSRTFLRMFSVSRSASNLAVCTPMTTSSFLIFLLQGGEVREDVVAIDAAIRPEVEQDDLAAQVFEVDRPGGVEPADSPLQVDPRGLAKGSRFHAHIPPDLGDRPPIGLRPPSPATARGRRAPRSTTPGPFPRAVGSRIEDKACRRPLGLSSGFGPDHSMHPPHCKPEGEGRSMSLRLDDPRWRCRRRLALGGAHR